MSRWISLIASGAAGIAAGLITGTWIAKKADADEGNSWKAYADKHMEMFLLMNQWVRAKQDGKSFASCLRNMGIKTIAVYGMHYIGETLIRELENTEIQILYGIDKNAEDMIYPEVDVITMDSRFEPVDAIIVTAITCFDEIKGALEKKCNCKIISIEDIVYNA